MSWLSSSYFKLRMTILLWLSYKEDANPQPKKKKKIRKILIEILQWIKAQAKSYWAENASEFKYLVDIL